MTDRRAGRPNIISWLAPIADVDSFIDQHNAAPKPFKPACNILASIEHFSIRSTAPDSHMG